MYNLKLKDVFIAPGRQVKNIGGRLVVFFDGLAQNVSETVAELARRQHYIEEVIPAEQEPVEPEVSPSITPEVKSSVEETREVVIEEPAEEEIPDEVLEEMHEDEEAVMQAFEDEEAEGFAYAEEVFDDEISLENTENVSLEETKTEEVKEEVEIQEPEAFADTEETEDGVLTAEEIQALYDEHGTWSAVAKHLDVSTSTLRKYREDAGLL